MRKGSSSKIAFVLYLLIVVISASILFNVYKKYYLNGFSRGQFYADLSTIVRDKDIKYSDMDSYKIESTEYNDALFFKEIDVEPNTPYRVTCMVKTEDVVSDIEKADAGAMICIYETTQTSGVIKGTTDWQELEFMFLSDNTGKAKIAFRLGGNEGNCTGKAWFSDFKLEAGTRNKEDSEWNFGCFIFTSLDVDIDSQKIETEVNLHDIENVKADMQRFASTCEDISDDQMTVKYDIHIINEPVTTISYIEDLGYYIDVNDVKESISDIIEEKEYDHVFLVVKMQNKEGYNVENEDSDWIGLGGMTYRQVGYSNIRLFEDNTNNIYIYDSLSNTFPEDVYVHEFLHDLERILLDRKYDIPKLHDYDKYGYDANKISNLKKWYGDYMAKTIHNEETNTYVGLDSDVYTMQPIHSDSFNYPLEIIFDKEPSNVIEEIKTIFKAIKEVIQQ